MIIWTKNSRKKILQDNNWIISKPIAHRGLHNKERPENSLGAFQAAAEHGYPIELDVRLSKDHEIMVFHDDDLSRATDINEPFENLSFSELKKIKLFNTNEKIPAFIEVLECVDGKVPLMIEVKSSKKNKILAYKLCEILSNYKGNFAIKSFDPLVLSVIRKIKPEYLRGQLSKKWVKNNDDNVGPLKRFILRNYLLNSLSVPDFYSYHIADLPDKKISRFKRKNMVVIGWTAKNLQDYEKAKLYCDNVVFENFTPA